MCPRWPPLLGAIERSTWCRSKIGNRLPARPSVQREEQADLGLGGRVAATASEDYAHGLPRLACSRNMAVGGSPRRKTGAGRRSEALQEPEEGLAIPAREIQERRGRSRPLPAMLSNRTLEGQGPPIMEKARPSPQAHERFRPKLGPPGDTLAEIGKRRPHIMQEQVGIKMDHLPIERLDRALRDECWDVTLGTPEPMKEFPTFVILTK